MLAPHIEKARNQVQAKLSDKVVQQALEEARAANKPVLEEMDRKSAEARGVKFVPVAEEKSQTSVTDSSIV